MLSRALSCVLLAWRSTGFAPPPSAARHRVHLGSSASPGAFEGGPSQALSARFDALSAMVGQGTLAPEQIDRALAEIAKLEHELYGSPEYAAYAAGGVDGGAEAEARGEAGGETSDLPAGEVGALSDDAESSSSAHVPVPVTDGDERTDALLERSIRFYDPRYTGGRERCYLVGLELKSGRSKGDFTLDESLNELSELAGTAGLHVCGSASQRLNERNPRTFIGTGKVRQVRAEMRRLGCSTVILDDELSPGQQRSLENEFGGVRGGVKVLDRTALILDIFAQHARTKEGQLQVELALTLYRMPRLTKLWTHLERQGGGAGGGNGGVGLRGPGERQIEVDRRLLRARVSLLSKQLDEVRRHRDLHRRRRKKMGLPVVALVGYTNAGKSTLLNQLSLKSAAFAENMLFATLDPTTRKCRIPTQPPARPEARPEAAERPAGVVSEDEKAEPEEGLSGVSEIGGHPSVLFTDTVGFIQKLPTNLVAAFRATLEEVKEADMLVHVVDVSNPRLWRKQKRAVDRTLAEMGLADKPTVVVWNKADAVGYTSSARLKYEAAKRPNTVCASALTGQGMDAFFTLLERTMRQELLEGVEDVLIPYERADLLDACHTRGAVAREEFVQTGVKLTASVPRDLAAKLKPFLAAKPPRGQPKGQKGSQKGSQKGQSAGQSSHLEGQSEGEEWDWAAIAKKRAPAPRPKSY